MKIYESICPLLTIAASTVNSDCVNTVSCDPEHCMLAVRGKEYNVWSCGLNQGVNRLAQGVWINCIEVEDRP